MSEFINDISKHLKVSESEAAFRTGLDNVKDSLSNIKNYYFGQDFLPQACNLTSTT